MSNGTSARQRTGSPIGIRSILLLVAALALLFVLVASPTQAQEDQHHPPAEKAAGEKGGGEHHGMSLVTAWKAFLIQLIGFGVLLAGFGWLVWPSLSKSLRAHGGAIADTYRRLDEAKYDSDRKLKDLEKKLAELPEEEKSRVHAAVAEGARIRDEMVREAEAQAARIVDKARREIEIARDAAVIEVREAVLNQALQAAEERLPKEIDVKTHHQLVNAFILDVEKARELIHKGGPA